MKDKYLAEAPVSTDNEFHDALTELLGKAAAKGVNVTGPWECHLDGSKTGWEAVVVELDNHH